MTQVRYFGFVKAEEPWTGNQFKMRILWDSFSDDEKPEWTSLEEIERFSRKMLEEEIY